MRRATSLMAGLAIIALVLALGAPATADDPPGFNGTIKIHAGDTENEPIRANEPHPGCTFHIHGFNFDRASSGTWRIVAWPPTGDGNTVVATGTWTANDSGDWRTAVMSLASGHYKAYADQNGAPGGEKQKVFWVECGAQGGGSTETGSTETGNNQTGSNETGGNEAGSTATPSPTQAGFQQGPSAAVTPIVENNAGGQTASQPGAQAGVQQQPGVAGQQQAPTAPQLAGLPNTSTKP